MRERRRLSEKIAMVYVGMFVTLGDGFSEESMSAKTHPHVQNNEVKPHLVLDFVQRLVENRYAHFDHDPLFVDEFAAGGDDVRGDHNFDDGEDQAEDRAWDWCPSGLPEPSWANTVVNNNGQTLVQHLWANAAEAVKLVRKLPLDTQELIAGNYVEESAWLILSMARPPGGKQGPMSRLVYLLSECA